MMKPTPAIYIRPLAPAIMAVVLMACQGDSTVRISPNQISVPVPTEVRQVAALRGDDLTLQITINDEAEPPIPVGWEINSPVAEDNIHNVTVLRPEDEISRIKIEWLMNIGNQSILLASFSENVLPDQTTLVVQSYIRNFDADGDGLDNLQEAIENRNPLSEFDAEVPLRTTFASANIPVLDDGRDTDLSGDNVEPDPLNTTFSLRHDGTNLIVYICGQDNLLVEDSRAVLLPNGQIQDQFWHDDTVFIYLDGGNHDTGVYDQIDDFQLAFVRQPETAGEMIVVKGGNNQFCPAGACITDYKFFNTSSSCEYEFDVRLPITDLNLTIGAPIGFDLEFTDDDNGDRRDSSRGWIGFDDASNIDPSTFGTIILR